MVTSFEYSMDVVFLLRDKQDEKVRCLKCSRNVKCCLI